MNTALLALLALLAIAAAPAAQGPKSEQRVKLPADPLTPVSVNGTSLSTVSSGTLIGGGYLERDGEHHTALPAHRARDNRFGTVELVSLIRHAAARVASEFPGTKLYVGNLSQRGGGDLKVSVSHNSGRDADLAFFATDAKGEPSPPSGFVRYDAQGRSRKPAGLWRFDVARNWSLVKALLHAHDVPGEVQFLFISRGLKRLMLEHARSKGENAELLRRADIVLKQPTGSTPHDDHLHLRVYCPPDDLMDGCRNYGPTWDWVDDHAELKRRRSLGLASILIDPEATRVRKEAALNLLEAIRGVSAAPWLITLAMPGGADAKLRTRALKALGTIRPDHSAHRLARVALQTSDPEAVAQILDVIAALGDGRVWPFVAALLGDTREVHGLRELESREPASKKLRHKGRRRRREPLGVRASRTLAALSPPDAVPALLDVLEHKDGTHRVWAAKAIRRITNARPTRTRWGRARLSKKKRAKGRLAWRHWWMAHRDHDRDRWLADGFRVDKPRLPRDADLVSDDAVPSLLKSLRSRERHIAHNAREVLRRSAKLRPWRQGDPYIGKRWWTRWWNTHRRRQRKGIHGGADVGVRGILRHDQPVPVRTRTL